MDMTGRLVLVLVLGFALSCGGANKGSHDGDEKTDPAGDTGAGAEPRGKTSDDALAPAADPAPPDEGGDDGVDGQDDECIKACLERNMARAVAAEIIRQDCETECADTQSPKE